MQFTKDTTIILEQIYNEYLTRRRNDIDKLSAREFDAPDQLQREFLQGTKTEDIAAAIYELKAASFVNCFHDDGFKLTDKAIIFMENRTKNRFKEVLDTISKFLPW